MRSNTVLSAFGSAQSSKLNLRGKWRDKIERDFCKFKSEYVSRHHYGHDFLSLNSSNLYIG